MLAISQAKWHSQSIVNKKSHARNGSENCMLLLNDFNNDFQYKDVAIASQGAISKYGTMSVLNGNSFLTSEFLTSACH